SGFVQHPRWEIIFARDRHIHSARVDRPIHYRCGTRTGVVGVVGGLGCGREEPSMSRLGRIRSSHRGRYQAYLLARASTAGTGVMRTIRASQATPTASPKAMGLMMGSLERMKLAKMEVMMIAAETTTRAEAAPPATMAWRGWPVCI